MRAVILTLLLLFALSPSPSDCAETAAPTGLLITVRTTNEGHGPAGDHESQILTELRLLDDRARQDNYAGGVTDEPAAHTTTLYFPESEEVVNIFHGARVYQRLGPEALAKQDAMIRGILEQQGLLSGDRPTLVETAETSEIDGQRVRKYTADSTMGKLTYWLTSEEAYLEAGELQQRLIAQPGGDLATLQFPDPATVPGFPLKTVIETNFQGVDTTSTTEQSIEFDVRFEPDTFEVPKGYVLTNRPPTPQENAGTQ